MPGFHDPVVWSMLSSLWAMFVHEVLMVPSKVLLLLKPFASADGLVLQISIQIVIQAFSNCIILIQSQAGHECVSEMVSEDFFVIQY